MVIGAELLVKEGIFPKINSLLKVEKNTEITINCIRIISTISKHSLSMVKIVLQELGVPWLIDQMNARNEEQVNSAQYCVQTVINALTGVDLKVGKQANKELCDEYRKEIDTILTCLVYCMTSCTITGLARDAILELVMRNCEYRAIDWAERFVDINGLQRLMQIASEMEELKYESSMEITASTRPTISVCLANVYENMYYDQARDRFTSKIDLFMQ